MLLRFVAPAVGLAAMLTGCNAGNDRTATTESAADKAVRAAVGSPATGQPRPAPSQEAPTGAAGWEGVYEGTIGGRYAVRLQLRQVADTLWFGHYYYVSQGRPLELQSRRQARGQLLLRETGPAEGLTGVFRVRLAADGALTGTWQDARTRVPLPVRLRRYDGSRPRQCQLQLTSRTYLGEYTVPVVRLPDAGLTRRLRQRFALETVAGMSLPELKEEHDNLGAEYPKGYHDLGYELGHQADCLLSLTFHSESIGANINTSYEDVTVDLATGFDLDILSEIAPARLRAFLAEGNRRLHRQLQQYIGGIQPNAYRREEHITGLKAQAFLPRSLFLHGDTVRLYHAVEYESMSHLDWKSYNHRFFADFTAAELQPYLRPESPLRRLAPAGAASGR